MTTTTLSGSTELSSNGMLSPDGIFYPCHSGFHDMTCEQILDSNRQILEKSGWIFIIKKEIFLAHPFDANWTIPQAQWIFCKEYLDMYPDELSMFWELRATRTRRAN